MLIHLVLSIPAFCFCLLFLLLFCALMAFKPNMSSVSKVNAGHFGSMSLWRWAFCNRIVLKAHWERNRFVWTVSYSYR